jgi:hypothetical protein
MDNLYDNEDVSRASENIQKHIKTSAKNSLYELKQH